jgi:hypothetical protein
MAIVVVVVVVVLHMTPGARCPSSFSAWLRSELVVVSIKIIVQLINVATQQCVDDARRA